MDGSWRICIALFAWALAQDPVLAADEPALKPGDEKSISVRHAYFEQFSKSNSPAASAATGLPSAPVVPEAELTPLQQRLEAAGAWLELMDGGDEDEHWVASECAEDDPLAAPSSLCGLRWRKTDGFTGLRGRFDDLSTGLKSKVVGKGLADNLELDVDSSPEIKFKWEWK